MRRCGEELIGTILFFACLGLAAAQVVDMRAEWPKGECLKKASDPKVARFKVVGPGRLEIHLYLDPYWHAGRAAFVPLSWTKYLSSGKSQGWGELGQAVKGQGYPNHFYQGGKEAGNWIDGAPWEMVSKFDVTSGEYNLGVQIGPPAILYGCGSTQWGQKARLVINYAPGGPGASATLLSIRGGPAPVSSSAGTASSATTSAATASPAAGDVVGLWQANLNGYPDQIEITRAGGGLTIKILHPNAPAEIMVDIGFDPTTGAIKFTRPLKAQGYPDQMYAGKLEGGKLSGTFGWAPKSAGSFWSAVRAK